MKKILKGMIMSILLICFTMGFTACNQGNTNETGQPKMAESSDAKDASTEHTTAKEPQPIATTPIVTMKIKDYGTVTLELYPEMAPNTVNNFIELANSGFYNGLTFHRIIKDFMIQGGDPKGTGTGGPGYSIVGEFAQNGYSQNTLSHTKGVISMARGMAPDTAGSQFFITSADSTFLDGQYAAFGKVTEGLDVIDVIQNVTTDQNDKPEEDVVIESITVETHGIEVPEVIKVD